MHRLLEQLSDLENDREELGEEEYAEMRQDTLEQVSYIYALENICNPYSIESSECLYCLKVCWHLCRYLVVGTMRPLEGPVLETWVITPAGYGSHSCCCQMLSKLSARNIIKSMKP